MAGRVGSGSQMGIVTDATVAGLYLNRLGLQPHCTLVVPPGDASKSTDRLLEAWAWLAEHRFGRQGVIVGLGGGMVCDLAGMAAATWMRGVELVLIPTTLEACIDACLGGKTAVNLRAGKNLVGAFHPASTVLIDVACLGTLPEREMRAGMAESIKHALLDGEEFLNWHQANAARILAGDADTLEELVRRNLTLKARIVERDPYERTGERMLLNLGHTIGHAVEAACDYRLRHGECVAIGLAAAARISAWMSLCDEALVVRVDATLTRFGFPTSLAAVRAFASVHPSDQRGPISAAVLMEFCSRDKKAADGSLRFVLLEGVGKPTVRDDVPLELVERACRFAVEGG